MKLLLALAILTSAAGAQVANPGGASQAQINSLLTSPGPIGTGTPAPVCIAGDTTTTPSYSCHITVGAVGSPTIAGSTTGLGAGWACDIQHKFVTGTTYSASAVCNDGNGFQLYTSPNTALGSESYGAVFSGSQGALSMNGYLAALWFVTYSETVAYSATPSFSQFRGISRIVLTGPVTSSTLPAGTDGEHKCFVIVQDATGGRTFVWPTNMVGTMTIGATANKHSVQCFNYNNTDNLWLAESTGVINQ
jgi:hypothetical protein